MSRTVRWMTAVRGSTKVSVSPVALATMMDFSSGVRYRWCGSLPVGRRAVSVQVAGSTTLMVASSELSTNTGGGLPPAAGAAAAAGATGARCATAPDAAEPADTLAGSEAPNRLEKTPAMAGVESEPSSNIRLWRLERETATGTPLSKMSPQCMPATGARNGKCSAEGGHHAFLRHRPKGISDAAPALQPQRTLPPIDPGKYSHQRS